jgi:hypothetical protein
MGKGRESPLCQLSEPDGLLAPRGLKAGPRERTNAQTNLLHQ